MIKALDFDGKMVLFDKPVHVKEAWFVVKSETHDRNLATIWNTKNLYGCKYSDDIEEKVSNMARRLFVPSPVIDKT